MHARARARAGYSTVSVRGNIAQNLLSPSADLPSVRLPRGRPTKTFFVSAKQKTSFGQSLFFSRRRRVRRASDASFILSAAPPSYAFRAVERRGRGVKKKEKSRMSSTASPLSWRRFVDAGDDAAMHPPLWWTSGSDVSCDSTTTVFSSAASTQEESSSSGAWPPSPFIGPGYCDAANDAAEEAERYQCAYRRYKLAVTKAAIATFVRGDIYSEVFYLSESRGGSDDSSSSSELVPWISNCPFDPEYCLVWKRTCATTGTGVAGYQHKLGPLSLSKDVISRDDLAYLKWRSGCSTRPTIHLVNVIYWMAQQSKHGRYDAAQCHHSAFSPTEDNLRASRRPRCRTRDCINPTHFYADGE